ncbi:MAG: histidine kinase [Sharpea porci]|uniref:sensor histidine kinase n=1 Tax=Sharpea porci TaxID=2652286 RepID=UPI0024098D4A|nr:histidine kinase [Sharpea porci]MDD6711484.1 histidine kinase [Sharpea porci]
MNKFVQFFRNMKVRYKIIMIYFVIGLFPLIFIGTLFFSQIKDSVIKQIKTSTSNTIELATSSLDSNIKVYNNLSDYLAYNETVANIVSNDTNDQFDFYKELDKTLDPMLLSVANFHTDLEQVTIYARDDIVQHGSTLAPITQIENESWFKKASQSDTPVWIINKDKKEVINVRKMPTLERNGILGILYIRMNYDQLFKSFNNFSGDNYGAYIVDGDNHILYEKLKFDQDREAEMLSFNEVKGMVKRKADNVIYKNSTETNWKVYYYHSRDNISDARLSEAANFLLLVMVVTIIAAAIALWATSKFIVSRLEALQNNIKLVEEGKLEVMVQSKDQDEIGQLITGFGHMINRIKFLIEEVYESKLAQKNYEMRALQQQINPHFLYNTLSMINFMAIESGQNDISKITLALSDFYRTALNKGHNTTCLADELKNMNAYLDIQQMMHDYEFDLDIEIDDAIMDYETPNLILQPIVENAIGHGIDLLEDRKGVLKVYATVDQENVYIMVEDNGVGMDEETINTMLSQNSKGYGMRNVNQRIKLLYGEEYGLHIESIVGQGTIVTIRLPKHKYEKRPDQK